MIRRFALALVLLMGSAAVALAAGAGGRWQGQIDTPDGQITVAYDFVVNGEDVTGTATGPAGELPVENGKVDGDILTFSLTLEDGTLILHEATVAEDTMAITARGPWGEFTFNVQRTKEE